VSVTPTFAWSSFARLRYVRNGSHTWFDGTEEELLDLVRDHWPRRRPGDGRTGLDQVVVVPVPCDRFVGSVVLIEEATELSAHLVRRQPEEAPYVEVKAVGPRECVAHAAVVLYSAETLCLNGGTRSSDASWEVVCLIASSIDAEPMDPLTMARNMLAKPGGTPCDSTALQFAEAVWYWSGRAKIDTESSNRG